MSVELVTSIQDVAGTLRISSRIIAEARGKRHDNVLQIIDRLLEDKPELGALNFQGSEYRTSQGKSAREYLCDERGSLLVGVNLGGGGGLEFQMHLIDAFMAARDKLHRLKLAPLVTDPLDLLKLATSEIEKSRARIALVESERDHLAKTKHLISTSREASAMGKVGGLTKQINNLDHKVKVLERDKIVAHEALKDYHDTPITPVQQGMLRGYCKMYIARMQAVDPSVNTKKLAILFWEHVKTDGGMATTGSYKEMQQRHYLAAEARAKLMADGALICVKREDSPT